MDPYPRRHYHKKRISALRLSSDSVPPLPVYSSPPTATWNEHNFHSDRPPDYPDSSEADADESDQDLQTYVPLLSPRRSRIARHNSSRSASQRHNQTSSDFYLDSLLARSVHALEMSNNILQSSMSTQTSLSTLLSSEVGEDLFLEDKTRGLSSRIKRNRALQKDWVVDINEIGKRLDSLYGDEEPGGTSDESISKSLPTSGLAPLTERNHKRRPSLQVLPPDGRLDYSSHDRSHFISPAPRALTIFIDSTDLPDNPSAIKLPSTLGHRSSPSLSSTLPLSSPQSPRRATFSGSERPNKAYDILSSFVTPSRQNPRMTSTSLTPTHSRSSSIRGGSPATTERRRPIPPVSRTPDPSDRTPPCKTPRGRSLSPLTLEPPSPTLPRPMTPPIEELSSSSPEPQYAVKSLRKILDVHTEAEQAKLARSGL